MTAEVGDEGPGFDPAGVPDPLAPEHLDRPSGRGLLLMRHFLSRVCHNRRGNCVCLCKHRSGGRSDHGRGPEENQTGGGLPRLAFIDP